MVSDNTGKDDELYVQKMIQDVRISLDELTRLMRAFNQEHPQKKDNIMVLPQFKTWLRGITNSCVVHIPHLKELLEITKPLEAKANYPLNYILRVGISIFFSDGFVSTDSWDGLGGGFRALSELNVHARNVGPSKICEYAEETLKLLPRLSVDALESRFEIIDYFAPEIAPNRILCIIAASTENGTRKDLLLRLHVVHGRMANVLKLPYDDIRQAYDFVLRARGLIGENGELDSAKLSKMNKKRRHEDAGGFYRRQSLVIRRSLSLKRMSLGMKA